MTAALLLALLLVGDAAWGAGAVVPVGSEFQVNDYTTGPQRLPEVAVDGDGDFVVVWRSFFSSGTDSFYGIQAQRFASDGTALGGQFQVNTYTTGVQLDASVAADGEGDFVVVWESEGSAGSDTSSSSIQGQRFGSDGTSVGSEFQINAYETGTQSHPRAAADGEGDFVVVWSSAGSAGSDSSGRSVQGQRFGSDGTALGAEFQMNTYTTGNQSVDSVAVETNGDFVVVWTSYGSSGSDSSSSSIQARRFASDGTALGGEFQVNTDTPSFQRSSAVAADASGDFVVVWETWAYGVKIRGQRFASNGSALGGEFQISGTPGYSYAPSVAAEGDGDFVVAWARYPDASYPYPRLDVRGRRYASNGTAVGGEFAVNTYVEDSQEQPAVAASPAGRFVVVWDSVGSSDTDSSDRSIQGQRFVEAPACSDGLDNDGDTLIDHPADPGCWGPLDPSEWRSGCGVGFEVAPALLVLAAARRARRRVPVPRV